MLGQVLQFGPTLYNFRSGDPLQIYEQIMKGAVHYPGHFSPAAVALVAASLPASAHDQLLLSM